MSGDLDMSVLNAALKAQIESNVTNANVVDTYESIPVISGVLMPSYVYTFIGPYESARGKGICGTQLNPHELVLLIECVSEDVSITHELRNDLLKPGVLVGVHLAAGSSALRLSGGYAVPQTSQDGTPVRFVDTLRFSLTYNL